MLQRRLKVQPCSCNRCERWRKDGYIQKRKTCPHCAGQIPVGVVKAEPACCGYGERHQHCPSCGWIISVGDWAAPPIATFYIRL
jgi:hypothetical protein